jgi:hypothetical protein
MRSKIWTDGEAENVLSISSFGLSGAVLVINGKRMGKPIAFSKQAALGLDWTDIPVKLRPGGNEIEFFLKPSTSKRPALRLRIQPYAQDRLSQLLPSIADKTRKDLVRVPGVLLASHLLSGGDEDFYNSKSKLYKLLQDPRLLKYIYYNTNKRNEAQIFIKFADSAAHAINSYHFQPRFNRFPPNWKFEGSNDGRQWTTLDDVAGFRQRGKTWVYNKKLENTTPYKQYRFLIPKSPFMVAWKDLQLYGE